MNWRTWRADVVSRNLHSGPVLLVSLDTVRENAFRLRKLWRAQFPAGEVFFPYKVNPLPEVCIAIKGCGFGAEVCSETEYAWARSDGHSQTSVVVNGPSRVPAFIEAALLEGATVNLDRFEEVAWVIAWIKRGLAAKSLSIGLRFQPWVDRLGRKSCFGMGVSDIQAAFGRIVRLAPGARIGLHLHFGNISNQQSCFLQALRETVTLAAHLSRTKCSFINIGSGYWPHTWDCGGGSIQRLLMEIRGIIAADIDVERMPILAEPGRTVVEDAGVLIGRVVGRKTMGKVKMLLVDCGQNVLRGNSRSSDKVFFHRRGRTEWMDIKGPLCYESDFIAYRVRVPCSVATGDPIVFCGAGSYCVPTSFAWSGYFRRALITDGHNVSTAKERH